MLIHFEKLTGTVSSGTFSTNTNSLIRGLLRHIAVKPNSETTTYDIKITNSDSIDIYERKSEIGTLSEVITLPFRGIYTVEISNSTADEEFKIQLGIQER